MLEGGHKSTNIVLALGLTIGGDAEKIVKNTCLLVIMHVRLSQKMGEQNLTNHTRFKKGNVQKQRMKSDRIQDSLWNKSSV